MALARRSVPAVISEIALCTLAAEHGATYYIKQYIYICIYYIKAPVFFFFECAGLKDERIRMFLYIHIRTHTHTHTHTHRD